MSATKLSPALKALIAAPHARGKPLPSPPAATTSALFDALRSSAKSNGVGNAAWVTLSTAALVTLNAPETLSRLSKEQISAAANEEEALDTAYLMRETGLKTISFSGIPRAINNLAALRASLPEAIASQLGTSPTRLPTPSNIASITGPRANGLWESIYDPHSAKLIANLAKSHPDLPVHILSSHYGALLSDPDDTATRRGKVGRILTSVVAIACLRAQGGVEPQVTSHVFGLRKALGGGLSEEKLEGQDWLCSEEGAAWVLESVDRIVEVVTKGPGTFGSGAGPIKAKL